jgi:hypothetical protein
MRVFRIVTGIALLCLLLASAAMILCLARDQVELGVVSLLLYAMGVIAILLIPTKS